MKIQKLNTQRMQRTRTTTTIKKISLFSFSHQFGVNLMCSTHIASELLQIMCETISERGLLP